MKVKDRVVFAGRPVEPGQQVNLELEVSESYAGSPVLLPFKVWRAERPGPTVFVTAAVHGDELNGTGIVRELILNPRFDLRAGTLVLVPVVNLLGFERHMRYLPDRRDLNRSFPGLPDGSMAGRFAHTIFSEIITRCDYGIDLHSAAARRTNFPNVRGDLRDPEVKRLAMAFGCELVVSSKGPVGSLRRSACEAGCPTMILEGGEVWKMEPTVIECGMRGIRNVLIELEMVQGAPYVPSYQTRVNKTKWVRADRGGLLQFHVAPGAVVEAGQPLATNTDLLGRGQNVVVAPVEGVILGMTTLPSVKPGDPICHVAIPTKRIRSIRRHLQQGSDGCLQERMRDDLATNVTISNPGDDPAAPEGDEAPDTE